MSGLTKARLVLALLLACLLLLHFSAAGKHTCAECGAVWRGRAYTHRTLGGRQGL